MQPYGSTSASGENARRASAIFRAVLRCGGAAESAQTLALIIKTPFGKTRNSVCSCSDKVITATPHSVMQSAFYTCKVNPRPL